MALACQILEFLELVMNGLFVRLFIKICLLFLSEGTSPLTISFIFRSLSFCYPTTTLTYWALYYHLALWTSWRVGLDTTASTLSTGHNTTSPTTHPPSPDPKASVALAIPHL